MGGIQEERLMEEVKESRDERWSKTNPNDRMSRIWPCLKLLEILDI